MDYVGWTEAWRYGVPPHKIEPVAMRTQTLQGIGRSAPPVMRLPLERVMARTPPTTRRTGERAARNWIAPDANTGISGSSGGRALHGDLPGYAGHRAGARDAWDEYLHDDVKTPGLRPPTTPMGTPTSTRWAPDSIRGTPTPATPTTPPASTRQRPRPSTPPPPYQPYGNFSPAYDSFAHPHVAHAPPVPDYDIPRVSPVTEAELAQ
mmetsp:Transcript_12823/g.25854  ORF Transcript_12823/g.25854 Transcript_12823/m.25854 type:complete len:207 (-) Transcript_12823:64-684(-)